MKAWNPKTGPVNGPKYLFLADMIEHDVAQGRLMPGDRLPPQRDIAEMFGVTVATVTKGIAEAARRGLVDARKGSGTYVVDRVAQPDFGQALSINLGLNILPSAIVDDLLSRSLTDVSQRAADPGCFAYASYQAHDAAMVASRVWLEKQGIPLGEDALPCHGVQQGLDAALAAFLPAGRQIVLCEAYTYTGILRAARHHGASAHGVSLDSEGMCPDALEEALRETGAAIVVVTPTVQNPTGRSMSTARRKAIARICRKHSVVLIEDAINMPLAGGEHEPICVHAPDNTVLLTGYSKCTAPGVRLAFASVPDRARARFHEALVATGWLAPRIFPELVAEMANSGALDECLVRHRAEARERQHLVTRHLGKANENLLPSYHCWIDLPDSMPNDRLLEAANADGVKITVSDHFCCENISPPRAIRISLGAEGQRSQVEAGIVRLSKVLKETGRMSDPII